MAAPLQRTSVGSISMIAAEITLSQPEQHADPICPARIAAKLWWSGRPRRQADGASR
jgi:hypothetical protein